MSLPFKTIFPFKAPPSQRGGKSGRNSCSHLTKEAGVWSWLVAEPALDPMLPNSILGPALPPTHGLKEDSDLGVNRVCAEVHPSPIPALPKFP